MQYVYEHGGTMLLVQYSLEGEDISFESVHLMDEKYRAIGPNIRGMLHELYVIDTEAGQGETVLSHIVGELECLN